MTIAQEWTEADYKAAYEATLATDGSYEDAARAALDAVKHRIQPAPEPLSRDLRVKAKVMVGYWAEYTGEHAIAVELLRRCPEPEKEI